jgi:hypothetical protein
MVASIRRADCHILTGLVLAHQAIICPIRDPPGDIQGAMPVIRHPPSLLVVLVLGSVFSTGALATPLLQQQFKDIGKPRPGTPLDTAQCRTCHTTPPQLNPFGLDMRSLMVKRKSKTFTVAIWKKLAPLDSDKDEASNKREVEAGTLPGDPHSKPAVHVERGGNGWPGHRI